MISPPLWTAYSFAVAVVLTLASAPSFAADTDAKNFITNSTGIVPTDSDPRIPVVSRQFADIRASCAGTSSSVAVWDKLAKAHTQLKVNQSLLALLADFVRVARASCSRIDDSTLIALYVIERNAGASHQTVINRLIADPAAILRKHGG